MTTTYEYTGTLTVIECAGCGMDFGIIPRFDRDRRRDHRTFYCPAGHSNYYPGKSDAEKARDEAARARRDLAAARSRATHLSDQLQAERRSKAAIKGHLTKVRKRIANGVCPCCQRSFANVRNHMANQHPDYVADLKAKEAEVSS